MVDVMFSFKWALDYKRPCPEPISALQLASVSSVAGFESFCHVSNPRKANILQLLTTVCQHPHSHANQRQQSFPSFETFQVFHQAL